MVKPEAAVRRRRCLRDAMGGVGGRGDCQWRDSEARLEQELSPKLRAQCGKTNDSELRHVAGERVLNDHVAGERV
eukprot:3941432-Rhodomonas_salina.3